MCVEYLVMDVDGTLTDGKIYVGANGELLKAFDVKDGLGIHELLPKMGITPVIITGRRSQMLENRCNELGIQELHQEIMNKEACLGSILESRGSSMSSVAYIGDDLNDLSCMNAVKNSGGVVGCPHDAVEEVQIVSDYIAKKCGGNGAVREFIQWLSKLDEEPSIDGKSNTIK